MPAEVVEHHEIYVAVAPGVYLVCTLAHYTDGQASAQPTSEELEAKREGGGGAGNNLSNLDPPRNTHKAYTTSLGWAGLQGQGAWFNYLCSASIRPRPAAASLH